jgi:hypothetical protein
MKQYVVDELRLDDHQKVKKHLDKILQAGSIGSVYWLPIEPVLLTPDQAEHTDCHPLCFAVELEPERLTCELLLRTQNRIRCSCIGYATEKQRNWVIEFVDAIFEQLDIMT